ncbi:MAG: GNAT family N-acetyltransferase [Acidobacteriota bacterium]
MKWQMLEGRPFLPGRRRVAVLAPCFPYPDAQHLFHMLRETACEFDVLLFAFADAPPKICEPVLEFCSRVILVPPAAGGHRSDMMQSLWDGLSREFAVDARQVESMQLALYGGDILVMGERAAGGWWGRLRQRRAMAKFKRLVASSELAVLREIADPPLEIRAARHGDLAELDRIQRASPGAVLWAPEGYLTYDCRVAEAGGRIAGFLVCRALADDESEVLSLIVDPALRRRGIAMALMREALAARPGTWFLEVRQSNWPARKLYERLGFEDISLRPDYYQDTGESAVVMRLKPCYLRK